MTNSNPRVLVATLSATDYNPRSREFFECLAQLEVPQDSEKRIFLGDALKNMDDATKYALDNNFTHIFFIDDDNAFGKDLLNNLLAHNVDIITGLYLQKGYPFKPVIFDEVSSDGSFAKFVQLNKVEQSLMELEACGMGCFLIKTKVFTKLRFPYYGYTFRNNVRVGCDILFCETLRHAGFRIFCDLTQICWHKIQGYVFPKFENGNWSTAILLGQNAITLPAYEE